MKQEEFSEQFGNRTKHLALSIIEMVGDLSDSDALGVLRKQLIRSATSVAANSGPCVGQDPSGKDIPNCALSWRRLTRLCFGWK